MSQNRAASRFPSVLGVVLSFFWVALWLRVDFGSTLPISVVGIWCLLATWVIREHLLAAATREELQIGCTYYGVWSHRGACKLSKHPHDLDPKWILGRSCDIESVRLVAVREEEDAFGSMRVAGGFILIEEGGNSTKFGVGLEMAELEWLHSEITDTMNTLKHSPSQKAPTPIQFVKMPEIVCVK